MAHNELGSQLTGVLEDLTMRRSDNLQATQHNRTLAARLFELVDSADGAQVRELGDVGLGSELQSAQAEAKEQRKRYRLIKSLLGGVVVSSGVDWARDDQLRSHVLDGED